MANHVYATVADMESLSVPAVALRDLDDAEKLKGLRAATSEADTYIESRYDPPLDTWPDALRLHVANAAAWHLMKTKGLNLESGKDEVIRLGYTDALKYYRDIAKGVVTLTVVETGPKPVTTPDVLADEGRGW